MADSTNETHAHRRHIIKIEECCLGNVPDEEVSFPKEQNTMQQMLAHGPCGSSANNDAAVKNFMHCVAVQACGIKCVDVKENMQLNLT